MPLPYAFVHGVLSSDPLPALNELNKIFSYNDPETQINIILQVDLLPRIVSLSMGEGTGNDECARTIQITATRLISNLFVGTPQQGLILAQNGVLDVLCNHLAISQDKVLLGETVLAIGNAVSDSDELRTHLKEAGVVQKLLTIILAEIHEGLRALELVEETVWALSFFMDAGVLTDTILDQALAVHCNLLRASAIPSMTNINLTLFKTLIPFVKRNPGRDYRMLLSSVLPHLFCLPAPALMLIGQLILVNDGYGICFIEANGLHYCMALLNDDRVPEQVDHQVLWILRNLAVGRPDNGKAIVETGLLPLIVPMLTDCFSTGRDAVCILGNACGLTVENQDFGKYLLGLGVVEGLVSFVSLAADTESAKTEEGSDTLALALSLIASFLVAYPKETKETLMKLWLQPETEVPSIAKRLLSLNKQAISTLVVQITNSLFIR